MAMKNHLFAIIIIFLILAFSIIHLGVAGGIIAQDNGFGDIFRQEIGLSGFNIVIGILGFAIAVAALFCILTNQGILSKIVAIGCGVLIFFTLASLIAALVINAKSFGDVNNRFVNTMNRYTTNPDSRNILDLIHTNYKCCGQTSWLDWNLGQSGNQTVTTTQTTGITTTLSMITTQGAGTTATQGNGTTATQGNGTTTIQGAGTTTTPGAGTTTTQGAGTTTTPGAGTTTKVGAGTTTTPGAGSTTTPGAGTTASAAGTTASVAGTTASVAGTTASAAGTTASVAGTTAPVAGTTASAAGTTTTAAAKAQLKARRDTNNIGIWLNPLTLFIRRKRQTVTTSSNLVSTSYSAQFSVPSSCCMYGVSRSNTSTQTTCVSSGNTAASRFYTSGCLNSLVSRVNQQNMGIGIINCFLIVLTAIAIPLLFQVNTQSGSNDRNTPGQHMGNMKYNMYPQIITTYH